MPWLAPRTWVNTELVDETIMNQHVKDNLLALKTPPASGKLTFAADFTTTSSSYVDITGLTTTLVSAGGGFDVLLRLTALVSSAAQTVTFKLVVDGADEAILGAWAPNSVNAVPLQFSHHIAALTGGSHTIKVQVKWNGTAVTLTLKGTTSAVGDPLFYVREAGN